ncbi:MAG TPA: RHS repeat-associated core domain-containing protein, partial [Anaerolineales bacterium]|nr:RHS repeat-associated core domain-containing protein [Anaerolineales bacterium]
ELTKYQYTGQYSHAADFGLMFYNARWYDPYLNHFTQPDSIVPDPYNSQDYDRYAYARNNPLRYTDPSGHFTEDAVLEYLMTEFIEYGKNATLMAKKELAKWKSDKQWWNMISMAKAGDVLFGRGNLNGGMDFAFTFTFNGSGNDSLTGITNEYGNGRSLGDIKNGHTPLSGEMEMNWDWIGFIQLSEEEPGIYVRDGYSMTSERSEVWQRVVIGGTTDVLITYGVAKLPIPPWAIAGLGGGMTYSDAAGFGPGTLMLDLADMQEFDAQVRISNEKGQGIYLNIQDHPFDGYMIEHAWTIH